MYIIKQNDLVINGVKHALMPHSIRKVIELPAIFIVLLTVPSDASMTENIFGVDHDSNIMWQIERIPETSVHPQLWYADMELTNKGVLRAYNWNGYAVEVNVLTGKVGAWTWSK